MTVPTVAFVQPPAAAEAPPAGTPAEPTEDMTPEEASAEIERLRTSEAKWKGLSRKHETENRTLKAAKAPAVAPAAGAPAATVAAVVDTSEADLKALRFEVALDKGLPKSLAVRLQGTTKEEMEEDAEDLAKLVAPKPVLPTGSADGGAGSAGAPRARPFDDWVRSQAGVRTTMT